jgi:hypothetical protein
LIKFSRGEWIGKAGSGMDGRGMEWKGVGWRGEDWRGWARMGWERNGLEWFNVKECLPESNQEVLAFGATGIFVGIYRRKFIPLSEDAPS